MPDRTRRTVAGVTTALRQPGGRAAFLLALVGYPPLYLASVGHLAVGARGYSIRVVADPVTRAMRSTRPFSFEPVARVAVDPLAVLISPLDIGVALTLAALVGCNLALAVAAWRSPATCGVEGSVGSLAGLPALLTGATCCGPAVLVALGAGAAGSLTAVLWYATPLAGALLVASLVFVAGRGGH